MSNCRISIIMPVFNREKTIRRAIDSILNQSYQDFELIIVDDLSTDNSDKIIQSYREQRIKYIKLDKNQGAAYARNIGIKAAIGDFIGFLDSDDEFADNFMTTVVNLLDDSAENIGFCWTAINIYKLNSSSYNYFNPKVIISSYRTLLQELRIGIGCGFVCKREVFLRNGYLNSDLRAAEDTEFILRISKDWDFTNTDDTFVNIYQIGNDRMSRNYANNAMAYNSFISQHWEEIKLDDQLLFKYSYKLMWLNFQLKNRKLATRYFLYSFKAKKASLKNIAIFLMYLFLPLSWAKKIHMDT